MLYVISRLVKSPLDFISVLSISNSSFMIYVVGMLINLIFSFIYAPIGILIQAIAFVYAIITLANTFKDSMEISDINKLVQYSTIVIGVLIIALYLIAKSYISSLLGSSLF